VALPAAVPSPAWLPCDAVRLEGPEHMPPPATVVAAIGFPGTFAILTIIIAACSWVIAPTAVMCAGCFITAATVAAATSVMERGVIGDPAAAAAAAAAACCLLCTVRSSGDGSC